jgi:hypothetical protein
MKVAVELTVEQWGLIGKLIDSVTGVENVRLLTPIYDAIKAAVQQDAGG